MPSNPPARACCDGNFVRADHRATREGPHVAVRAAVQPADPRRDVLVGGRGQPRLLPVRHAVLRRHQGRCPTTDGGRAYGVGSRGRPIIPPRRASAWMAANAWSMAAAMARCIVAESSPSMKIGWWPKSRSIAASSSWGMREPARPAGLPRHVSKPRLPSSTDVHSSLLVWNASSSAHTLLLMLIATVIGLACLHLTSLPSNPRLFLRQQGW